VLITMKGYIYRPSCISLTATILGIKHRSNIKNNNNDHGK